MVSQNDMIKHLGPAAKKTLLELFKESWKNGTVPALWKKKATIIPVHKKGKDKKDPNSYRPISLLSCLGKLLEHLINRRLISCLEERKILSPTQTGYRKHRSTEDQLALIAQEIDNAFQEKKKVVFFFFDLTKAFDKVWRGGLLLKILKSGGSGILYRWIRCFLHDRSARIKLDGYFSRSVKMREGVPQGGVISPTLFLLHINNITTVLPRHVSNTLHADDLVWSASEYTTSSAYKSFWQSLAWRSPAEDTWERRFWNNVQMDPMLLTRQISQNKTGWLFQQKRENARRSPTGRSHLTDTLSPAHQQHHDCASPTCLQHPTCRWSRMECIWIHHIFCLQKLLTKSGVEVSCWRYLRAAVLE